MADRMTDLQLGGLLAETHQLGAPPQEVLLKVAHQKAAPQLGDRQQAVHQPEPLIEGGNGPPSIKVGRLLNSWPVALLQGTALSVKHGADIDG